MNISVESVLLVLSILFFVSIWIGKVGGRFGVPVLLLFLGVGMFFGSDGIGIKFSDLKQAEAIGTIALCIILFSGGMDTKFKDIQPIIKHSVVLATIGVLLTAFITGLFTWWLCGQILPSLGIGLLTSFLFASAMSSTDSASVFAILRSKNISLKNNLRPTLELESGSNDPMAYILTITLIQLIQIGDNPNLLMVAGTFIYQLVMGAFLGYLLGKLSVYIINKIKIDNDSLYPILVFTFCVFIFSFTNFVHGNGFLAIYIGGLIIGNSKFVHKRSSIKFFDGLAWFSQILMFLTLGLLVNPEELLPIAIPGLIIGVFMIFVARPLSVFISLAPFKKVNYKDKLFISWVGLRGAVPIIFAIYPLTAGIPHARFIFNVVFFITLLSLLLQGTFLDKVAKWLGLIEESKSYNNKLEHFDLEFSEDIGSMTAEITLNEYALEEGNKLMDLPLPNGALVVMVKRDHEYFIPKGKTELRVGDKLLIITDDEEGMAETYKSMGINDTIMINQN